MEKVKTTVTIPRYIYEYLKEIVRLGREKGIRISMSELVTDSLDYYMDYVNIEGRYLSDDEE